MKKILVPVDFSEHTGVTCRYAIEFARAYSAEIRLFHTYFDQIMLPDTRFPDTLDMSTIYNEELMKEVLRQAADRMKKLESTVREELDREGLRHIPLSSVLTGGELEHELRGICHDYRPDLVVMGTTGMGMNVNVWGKVSTFIIQHARVPVLTVPPLNSFKGFGNLMFAADLTFGNAGCLTGLLDLLAPFRVPVRVAHFTHPEGTGDARKRLDELRNVFVTEEAEGRVLFDLVEVTGDNQTAINHYVGSNGIRMIAFLPHRHGPLYSFFTRKITKKNFFATQIPLLSLPSAV